jgi:hypothetical protein
MNETKFLEAMSTSLRAKEFQVPGHWQDVNVPGQLFIAKTAAEVAKSIAESALGVTTGPMKISGGAKEDEIARAMTPVISLANLVGFRYAGAIQGNALVAVILADRLTASEVAARFPEILSHGPSIAALGYRINWQTLGLLCHPMVVYLNQFSFDRDVDEVLSHGWQTNAWRKIYLKAAVVNVAKSRIHWAKPTGLARFGYSLGVKNEPFNDRDIADVVAAATD